MKITLITLLSAAVTVSFAEAVPAHHPRRTDLKPRYYFPRAVKRQIIGLDNSTSTTDSSSTADSDGLGLGSLISTIGGVLSDVASAITDDTTADTATATDPSDGSQATTASDPDTGAVVSPTGPTATNSEAQSTITDGPTTPDGPTRSDQQTSSEDSGITLGLSNILGGTTESSENPTSTTDPNLVSSITSVAGDVLSSASGAASSILDVASSLQSAVSTAVGSDLASISSQLSSAQDVASSIASEVSSADGVITSAIGTGPTTAQGTGPTTTPGQDLTSDLGSIISDVTDGLTTTPTISIPIDEPTITIDTSSIITPPIDTGSITTPPIDTGSVTIPIDTGSITTPPIDTGSVTTPPIDTGSVTTPPIDTGSVTTPPIDTASVTTPPTISPTDSQTLPPTDNPSNQNETISTPPPQTTTPLPTSEPTSEPLTTAPTVSPPLVVANETTSAAITSRPTTSAPPTNTIKPTGTDSQTALVPDSSILTATSAAPSSGPSSSSAAVIPTSLPSVIQPEGGIPDAPENSTLIQLGFTYGLNYQFVVSSTTAVSQIFSFIPPGVSHGLNMTLGNVTMQYLQPYNTMASVGYITTLAMAYIPASKVDLLSVLILNPNSGLFHNDNPSVTTLMSMIDPSIPILAGSTANGGTPINTANNPATTSDDGKSDGASPGSDGGSSGVRPSSVGIAVGAVAGATVYGAAMFLVARRYKKKKAGHQRTPSNTSSQNSRPGEQSNLMAAGARGSYGTRFGGRTSRNSDHSNSNRSGRTYISPPVMAENSLGWN